MSNEKCNGWTNYETWAVKLWLDNDDGAYRHWRFVATECMEEAEAGAVLTKTETAAYALAALLKEEHETAMAQILGDGASVFHDLLGAALSEVNWAEIGTAYMDDLE